MRASSSFAPPSSRTARHRPRAARPSSGQSRRHGLNGRRLRLGGGFDAHRRSGARIAVTAPPKSTPGPVEITVSTPEGTCDLNAGDVLMTVAGPSIDEDPTVLDRMTIADPPARTTRVFGSGPSEVISLLLRSATSVGHGPETGLPSDPRADGGECTAAEDAGSATRRGTGERPLASSRPVDAGRAPSRRRRVRGRHLKEWSRRQSGGFLPGAPQCGAACGHPLEVQGAVGRSTVGHLGTAGVPIPACVGRRTTSKVERRGRVGEGAEPLCRDRATGVPDGTPHGLQASRRLRR